MTNTRPRSQRLLISSGLFFAGCIACLLSFNAIGSHVDQKGTLREPFFLLPSSALLLLGSTVCLVAAGVTRLQQGK